MLRSGRWERLRPGAYVELPPGVEPFARQRLLALGMAKAVSAQSFQSHVLSHETAALLHGLPLVGAPAPVHLVQAVRPGQLNRRDVRRHFFPVPNDQRTERHGLPVTTLERTVVDCAMSLGRRDGLVIADAALHVGADLGTCKQILQSLAGRRGVVAARWALEMADGGSESPGETHSRFAVLLDGLPRPVTQVRVDTHLGAFWGDFGWPETRVLIEYDGLTKYEANGSASSAVLAEKRREDALRSAGWVVIRVTAAGPSITRGLPAASPHCAQHPPSRLTTPPPTHRDRQFVNPGRVR